MEREGVCHPQAQPACTARNLGVTKLGNSSPRGGFPTFLASEDTAHTWYAYKHAGEMHTQNKNLETLTDANVLTLLLRTF